MASASVQAGGVGVVQPAQPPPRAAPRSPWAVGTAPDIASVYLRVAGSTPGTPALEGAVRMLQWPERDLRWLDCRPSPPPDAGCLFSSDDAYCDSASAQVLPPWRALPTADRLVPPDPDAAPSAGAIDISCRVKSAADEEPAALAGALLQWLGDAAGAAAAPLGGAVVLFVARCPRLPMLPLPNGLRDLHVDVAGPDERARDRALETLQWAGLLVLPGAVDARDLGPLRRLARRRIDAFEAQLRREGHAGGLGGGDFSYAEVCARGRQRWDMLLHAPPAASAAVAASAPELELGEAAGVQDGDAALLERIATASRWAPLVSAALGDDYTWQVSLICSRPGAPAGRWHADGGHTPYSYGEEGTAARRPYALCAFVPLVPLSPPRRAGAGGAVAHGRGCTAFWPGSHLQAACLQLGAAASQRLRAVVPGAPLDAGDALVYDYRTVHCGSPNEADVAVGAGAGGAPEAAVLPGERPILQFTFCRCGYRDRIRNYGWHQLFYD